MLPQVWPGWINWSYCNVKWLWPDQKTHPVLYIPCPLITSTHKHASTFLVLFLPTYLYWLFSPSFPPSLPPFFPCFLLPACCISFPPFLPSLTSTSFTEATVVIEFKKQEYLPHKIWSREMALNLSVGDIITDVKLVRSSVYHIHRAKYCCRHCIQKRYSIVKIKASVAVLCVNWLFRHIRISISLQCSQCRIAEVVLRVGLICTS